jgi:hypothetical protein
MTARDLFCVLLGWFNVYLLVGFLVGFIALVFSIPRPLALLAGYLLQAAAGLWLVSAMEDRPFREVWKRAAPSFRVGHVGWALGFFSLAILLVLMVALALSPLIGRGEPPQRELTELIAATQGIPALLMMSLMVAVLAPLFEEFLFRGVLLTWLAHHLEALWGSRWGWTAALVISSLLFGIMHLQLLALPVLSTLGLVLGLTYLRTGNLWAPVIVHGLWNGGVFLFLRVVVMG